MTTTSTTPHFMVVRQITALVREHGAERALDIVRDQQLPVANGQYHETLAVFLVWATDRLISAGLTDMAIDWHPLVDARSPLSWWDGSTLRSEHAAREFVSPTLAGKNDPRPAFPIRPLAAA